MAASSTAAFAEYVVADARLTFPLPRSFSLDQAVALPTALLTEHGALRADGFVHGHSVLVTGATSAIGLAGVQMANSLGASWVFPSTRSADKADLLRQLGAEGVDLVLERVAGPMLAQAIYATRKHGTVVQMGRLGGTEAIIDVDAVAFGRVTLVGVFFGHPDELAEPLSGVREQVLPMVFDGRIRPVVHAVLPFPDAERGRQHGPSERCRRQGRLGPS